MPDHFLLPGILSKRSLDEDLLPFFANLAKFSAAGPKTLSGSRSCGDARALSQFELEHDF
jgi:hypothetical protein